MLFFCLKFFVFFICKILYFYHLTHNISFYRYETSDGVSRSEEAQLKNVGTENEALVVRGTVTWVAADGQTYTLNYVADENGFQPEGAHLPKGP